MGAIDFSVNEELLRFCAHQTAARRFVETGTFRGDSTAIGLKVFEECWSVELSPALFEAARQRFADEPRLRLFQGESPAFLKSQAEAFRSSPTVFWLDAHWCAADHTAGEDSQSPLLEELQALAPLHADGVVLIDDARLYLSPPPAPHRVGDWPSFQDLLESCRQAAGEHGLSVLNDVLVLYPKSRHQAFFDYFAANGVDWLTIANEARDLRRRRARRPWPFKRKPF